jgi:hypothetical protein
MQPPYVSGGVTARQMVARRSIRDRIDDPLGAVGNFELRGMQAGVPRTPTASDPRASMP